MVKHLDSKTHVTVPKLPVGINFRLCQPPKQGIGCGRDTCHARVLPNLREQACPLLLSASWQWQSQSAWRGRFGSGPVSAKVLPYHIGISIYNLILKRLFYSFLTVLFPAWDTGTSHRDCIVRVQLTMQMKIPTNTWWFLSRSEPSCMEQFIGPWHISIFKLREEKVVCIGFKICQLKPNGIA